MSKTFDTTWPFMLPVPICKKVFGLRSLSTPTRSVPPCGGL
ncbi:Uncharacterised protein [Mycobacteroides abscessus subsp. abscessus]|nr:Uncharacterised protein [Mycobacteroides abscessus subsp. abscessus]